MNIAIIGCGYIGLELATIWKRKGYSITAAAYNSKHLNALSKISQKSVLLKGDDEEELVPFIANCDAIVILLASDYPELSENIFLNTSQMIRHLALEMDMPRQLICTSSTLVYGDHRGQWVDEASGLLADSEQAKVFIETEKNFLATQEVGWRVCILRLAEIYGPGKELSKRIRQLEGIVLPGNGAYYTNMVHKRDCADAIDYALRHHLEGIYNLADDKHPTRQELYDAISHQFNLPKIKWDPKHVPLHAGNKRISNHKIKAEGFVFLYPHRVLD